MEKYYHINSDMKNKRISEWLKSQEGYVSKKRLAGLLKGMAGLIVVVALVAGIIASKGTYIRSALPLPVMTSMIGLIIGILPWCIGQSIIHKARREYGEPYIKMEKEFLYANNSGIQFGYHDITDRNRESVSVYQIAYDAIAAVHFEKERHLLTIIGAGEMIVYDDMAQNRINTRKSQRKFYSNSPYSILLYIDEEQEFLDLLSDYI